VEEMEIPVIIREEYLGSEEEAVASALLMRRLRMQMTFSGGWAIGERFDERYDTEAGGNQLLVTQSIGGSGALEGVGPASLLIQEFSTIPKQARPARIVDYGDGGKYYSQEEAESVPSLSPVLARLQERIAEYGAFQKNK
jgi:hypothetical protein